MKVAAGLAEVKAETPLIGWKEGDHFIYHKLPNEGCWRMVKDYGEWRVHFDGLIKPNLNIYTTEEINRYVESGTWIISNKQTQINMQKKNVVVHSSNPRLLKAFYETALEAKVPTDQEWNAIHNPDYSSNSRAIYQWLLLTIEKGQMRFHNHDCGAKSVSKSDLTVYSLETQWTEAIEAFKAYVAPDYTKFKIGDYTPKVASDGVTYGCQFLSKQNLQWINSTLLNSNINADIKIRGKKIDQTFIDGLLDLIAKA